jgi:hypothetical protein
MTNINNLGKALAKYCGLSLLLLSPALTNAQFSVSPNKTAAQLSNVLLGASSGIVITNPSLTCPTQSNGTYSNVPNAVLGIGSGVLLTNGNAAAVDNVGSVDESTTTNAAGDASLSALIGGTTTYDACILEFDFVPQGDSIKFRYQFGSEEYPDFSCSPYNDVFGFFISGPGYGSPTNIALVPGTNIPVAINRVTGGATGGPISTCNAMGPGSPFTSLFINNAGSSNKPVYDGYTTTFIARAKVTPCSTYHLKLGVADATDRIISSGVFVEAGSLTILPPTITGCPSNITTCNPVVSWTPPTVVNNCLNITDSTKSHVPGATFPVGTTTVTYTYTNIGGTSTCSFTVTVIADNIKPDANCKNTTVTLVNGAATITPADVDNGSTDNCAIKTMTISPSSFTCADTGVRVVTLTVTDFAGNTDTCKSNVTVVYPSCSISVMPSSNVFTGGNPNNLYLGYGAQTDTLKLNGGTGTYSWSPAAYLSATNVQNPVFTPVLPGTYVYNGTITYANGCKRTCSVTICVKEVRVNGYQGRAVWVCHRTSPTALGLNQITLLAAVPSHMGPHPYDFLGRCDQICEGYPDPGTDQHKPAAPTSITNYYQTDFLVNTYPNPFSNDMHLKIESNSTEKVDVVIYDIAGKILETLSGQKANTEISIGSKLAPGVYLIDVKQGEVSQRTRVVKIK